jgi:signal transduction histidine kinase
MMAAARLKRLHFQQAAIASIASFGSFAVRERDLLKILTEAARACAESLGVPFSNVCRYRAEHKDLVIVVGYGWRDRVIGDVVALADASSPQGRAFITGKPSICKDLRKKDLRKHARVERAPFYAAHGIVSTVDVIIKGSGEQQPYGILEIDNDRQHDYDQYDIDFLTAFANVLAEAVSTATRRAALQVSVDRMTELMAERDRLLGEKDASELRLRQAQKMEAVGHLTGGIAHDLNNILTVITGAIDILGGAVADRPEVTTLVKMIDAAATRGGDLTQRLLAFARKQPLQPREVDINSLVIEATEMLRTTLRGHVEVLTRLAAGSSLVLIEPSQLHNAILNLAFNARDAMSEGGRLTIETSDVIVDGRDVRISGEITAGRYVMVAVTDSGHGIPADLLDRVFEPLFTTKDVGKGSGLGLSMVYGFVKESHGHIDIHSEVGRGTTVKIYLPSVIGAARPAEVVAASPPKEGGDTILVVADDPPQRTLVSGQSASLGYATLVVDNAAEASAVLQSPQKIPRRSPALSRRVR